MRKRDIENEREKNGQREGGRGRKRKEQFSSVLKSRPYFAKGSADSTMERADCSAVIFVSLSLSLLSGPGLGMEREKSD